MIPNDCPVSVYTLFSSSSGNSIYVTDGKTRFLIDAGCNMKRLCAALSSVGAQMSDVTDIFITHEHGDHTGALSCLHKKYVFSVRAVKPTAAKLGLKDVIRITEGGQTRLGGFTVTPFRLSHDTSCCVGYTVLHECGVSFASITDTGYVTEEAKNALCGVDAVILESNYDEYMLNNGPYPPDVKQRIRSEKGHLSNSQASEFLPFLYGHGTSRVLLAHISKENNTKEKAYESACRAAAEFEMKELGIKCADQFLPTRLL